MVPAGPEDLLHVGPDAGPQVGIQRRERLVEQDQLRLDGQRPGQGDPLLLAAGQLVRVALAQPGQADGLQQLADARAAPRPWAAGRSRRWPPRSGAGTGCLPGARSRSGASRAARACPARRRSTAADLHGPGVGLLEPGQHAQQRGLAAAGRAQDRGQRPGRHGQVQPGQHRRAAPKALCSPLHGQLRSRGPVLALSGAVEEPAEHVARHGRNGDHDQRERRGLSRRSGRSRTARTGWPASALRWGSAAAWRSAR